MKIDEEFKSIIPPLTPEEFQQLEANILAEGIRDSLVTWQGVLIDGHNRYNIATKYGLSYRTTEKQFESKNDVIIWIIQNQFGRRNLSAYHRSLLALKLKPMFEEKAKENILASQNNNNSSAFQKSDKQIHTSKELAKVAGVSHDTIAKVQKIEQQATPEIKQKLNNGEISIDKAYQGVRIEEKRQKRIEESKKNQFKVYKDDYFILGDSIEELKKLEDKSIDCVLTDPPYGIDYVSNRRIIDTEVNTPIKNDDLESALNLWEATCKILDKKAKDDCHIYIFTSWKVFHHFRDITEKYFKIKNCLIWQKNVWSMGDLSGNYAEQYEMILFATRGNKELIGRRDSNILQFSKVASNNLIHSCEKPTELLEYLIKKSTIENELVIDPFAGSGSTIEACKKTNRRYWGCEIDKENYNKAMERLNNG